MSQNLSSSMQPLSVGNVVTAGVRLYRSHLKTYLKLAAYAYLWALVPVYGWAKYAAMTGLISRLAFGELINQPENVNSARGIVMPRFWSFLRVGLQVAVSLFLLYLGLLIIGVIFAGIIGFIVGAILGQTAIAVAAGISGLIVVALLLLGLLWFYSHWVICTSSDVL